MTTALSVNINKIATLRNARGQNLPDPVHAAREIISYGSPGITVHPRPDERHIRKDDVYALHRLIKEHNQKNTSCVEFNIEGYPNSEFLNLIEEVRPHQCTLVPDPPDVITSNAGWDLIKNEGLLSKILDQLKKSNVRASLFIDPDTFTSEQFDALKRLQPERIELYTENFAKHFASAIDNSEENKALLDSTIKKYSTTAQLASSMGIRVNAGHDLNQDNLGYLIKFVPEIVEVSIGHALICEALYDGLETTVINYLNILSQAHNI